MRQCLFLVLLFAGVSAASPSQGFDNIEADAAYNGKIREKIETEFRQGLKLLRDQADKLKMDVREQDVVTLKHHMYDKALLMGACVDQGLSIQKTLNKKVVLEKFVTGCVATHLKFAQEQRERQFARNNVASATRAYEDDQLQNYRNRTCLLDASRKQVPPNSAYEFLQIESGYSPIDYLAEKRCYEASHPPSGLPGLN